MKTVIVLNADYSFMNVVSVKRAMLYISKGKVQIEKYVDGMISTVDQTFRLPLVVRFIKFIRQIYSKKVPWSKKNVLIRDNYTCQYCNSTDGKMTVDHVIPKSKRGKNTFENTVCACGLCNNMKANRTPTEAGMFLKRQPTQPTISEFTRKMAEKMNIVDILGFVS